jgi:hypothetical protein
MELLVAAPVAVRGGVLGFRFFPQTEGYLSCRSSTVMFMLTKDLTVGSYLRLTDGGSTLLQVSTPACDSCTTIAPASPDTIVGTSTTAPGIADFASCYVFWTHACSTTHPQGVAFVGFALANNVLQPTAPPEHVLPAEYCTVVSTSAVSGESTQYMRYAGDPRIHGSWKHAWRQLKYGGYEDWVLLRASSYADAMASLRLELFVGLEPGQLTPIAYRPHALVDTGFAAQLVVVATAPIPACAVVYIVPTLTGAGSVSGNIEDGCAWVWRAPSHAPVPVGTVIDFRGLGFNNTAPRASCGTLTRSGMWPDEDFAVHGFTLYNKDAMAITAVYSRGHAFPIPDELTPGFSMPLRPWPTTSSVVPIHMVHQRPIRDWPCEQVRLNHMDPVRWVYQPLPAFRTFNACTAGAEERAFPPVFSAFMGDSSGTRGRGWGW